MRCCSGQMCDSMSDIAANLLKGNIPLTDCQFLVLKVLKRHAKGNEALSKKKTQVLKSKEILQKGGFLSALLGPVMRFLMPVVKPDVKSRRPLRPSSWNDMEHYNEYYLVDASEFDDRKAKSPPTSYREQRRHDIEHSYKNLLRELVDQSA